MVIVCLAVVLQDLPADVLCALVEGFVHAVGPGDRAFLFAVILLQERADRVGARPLSRGSGPRSWHPPPCSPHPLIFSTAVPYTGSPSSLCPCPLLWGLPPPSVPVPSSGVSLLPLSRSSPLGSPSSLCSCPLLWGLPPPSVPVSSSGVSLLPLSLSPLLGSPSSLCPCYHCHCPRALRGTSKSTVKLYASFKMKMGLPLMRPRAFYGAPSGATNTDGLELCSKDSHPGGRRQGAHRHPCVGCTGPDPWVAPTRGPPAPDTCSHSPTHPLWCHHVSFSAGRWPLRGRDQACS